MKILLDTHALLWWLAGDVQLSTAAREAIGEKDNTVFVSAASAWEICTKVRIGKLPGAHEVAMDLSACLISQNLTPLSISVEHAQRAGNMPGPLRDPFDRMLVAQAQALDISLVSNEKSFDHYGIRRLW